MLLCPCIAYYEQANRRAQTCIVMSWDADNLGVIILSVILIGA